MLTAESVTPSACIVFPVFVSGKIAAKIVAVGSQRTAADIQIPKLDILYAEIVQDVVNVLHPIHGKAIAYPQNSHRFHHFSCPLLVRFCALFSICAYSALFIKYIISYNFFLVYICSKY